MDLTSGGAFVLLANVPDPHRWATVKMDGTHPIFLEKDKADRVVGEHDYRAPIGCRSWQNRARSELGACQNSGTVEAVWVGTASGEDEDCLLQGCGRGQRVQPASLYGAVAPRVCREDQP